MYIHDLKEWPNFRWNNEVVSPLLVETHERLKVFNLELSKLGFEEQNEASLRTLTEEVVRTSEIEGEILDPAHVRSSIARKLGLAEGGLQRDDHNVEGIVDVVLEATQKCELALTEKRLCGWHAALFPTGYSGTHKILVAQWRDDRDGPMQVVSGPYGNRKIHFEAPAHLRLVSEMEKFFAWFEGTDHIDLLVKAGIAHLYFVTLHPFDDGNGRIARAIADMELARADKMKQRYYSMSAQIKIDKKEYYDTLEATQKATLDITNWLVWFLECLIRAIKNAETVLHDILQKARVWQHLNKYEINERQGKILNTLLDGIFYGNLNSGKYAKMTKCSTDTANRDLSKLVEYGVLDRVGEGRGTHYVLKKLSSSE
ncbi:MAG: Fic family protein [Candidatus Obscuribacterales bacterium]|nr:Fic family protein [Candidatus Obscuribacterales bacterium]